MTSVAGRAGGGGGREGFCSRRTVGLPDVEGVGDGLLLRLVLAADVVAPPLVGDQLPVGLHHHRVEVLDTVLLSSQTKK